MKEMNAGGGETIVRILEQGRRSRRDPPLRRGRGSDQDPAGSRDVDGVRLRRVDGDARASALLRIVSAPARPLRARAEDHVVGAGDQEVVVAAGLDDRHERSRADRARHGRGHRRLRSEHDHRSRDLRGSGAAVRRREARVRQRRARAEGRRADRRAGAAARLCDRRNMPSRRRPARLAIDVDARGRRGRRIAIDRDRAASATRSDRRHDDRASTASCIGQASCRTARMGQPIGGSGERRVSSICTDPTLRHGGSIAVIVDDRRPRRVAPFGRSASITIRGQIHAICNGD